MRTITHTVLVEILFSNKKKGKVFNPDKLAVMQLQSWGNPVD